MEMPVLLVIKFEIKTPQIAQSVRCLSFTDPQRIPLLFKKEAYANLY